MKVDTMKYIKLVAAALSLLIGFSACQKPYDPTPDVKENTTQNPLKGKFTCTENGFQFTASEKGYTLVDNDNGTRTLSIWGTKFADQKVANEYERINLIIQDYKGPGKYTCNDGAIIVYTRSIQNGKLYTFTSDANPNYFVQVSSEFKGLFNSTVTNTQDINDRFQIVDGVFDVTQ